MTPWVTVYVMVTFTLNAVTGEVRKDEWGRFYDYRRCEAALDVHVAVARALSNAEPGDVGYVKLGQCGVEI